MGLLRRLCYPTLVALFVLLPILARAADIDRFVGSYSGETEIVIDGAPVKRDMSVKIAPTKEGFLLNWTSTTYRADGRVKVGEYAIEFVPSARDHIYQAAMKTNLFGKATPLDPLKGEPFVWARFEGDMFSVFSLFINEVGDYEIQEFHRTLVEGGLDLGFRRVLNGTPQREINTFLKRED